MPGAGVAGAPCRVPGRVACCVPHGAALPLPASAGSGRSCLWDWSCQPGRELLGCALRSWGGLNSSPSPILAPILPSVSPPVLPATFAPSMPITWACHGLLLHGAPLGLCPWHVGGGLCLGTCGCASSHSLSPHVLHQAGSQSCPSVTLGPTRSRSHLPSPAPSRASL